MAEWPKFMDELPYDWWNEEELNKWLQMYRQYVETQRLKEIMRKEK